MGAIVEPPRRLSVSRRGVAARWPELALGVLLVAGCALGAVLWHASGSERVAVAVLAADVPGGEVVTAGDLRAADVAGVDGLRLVPWERADRLVGLVAVTDLRAGTPLSSDLVAAEPRLRPGEGLVSLDLAAGSYPAAGFAVGDVVDVVHAGAPDDDPAAPATLVATGAEVWAVAPADDGSALVTLRLDADGARRVGARATAVRLVRVVP